MLLYCVSVALWLPLTSHPSNVRRVDDALRRYMANTGPNLRDYLPRWQGHIAHWIAEAVDIPIYVFRYEDMLYRSEEILRQAPSSETAVQHFTFFSTKNTFIRVMFSPLVVEAVLVASVRMHVLRLGCDSV